MLRVYSSAFFFICYRSQTKLRQGNVFTPVCQSFCSRGVGGVCATHTPLPCMPPGMYTPWHICPPWHAHPLLHMPPPCHACPLATPVPCHAHSPAMHAPCHACPNDMRSMSGRYASYLNAFLFQNADVRYIR